MIASWLGEVPFRCHRRAKLPWNAMVYRSGGENAGTVKCDVLSRRERRACVFVSRDVFLR